MTRVRAEDLETGAVSRRAIRPGAVGRDELDERLRPGGGWWQGAVGKGMIAPGGVIAGNIAPGAVQAPDLDDNSVTAPKIAPGSVTGPALADGSVSGPKVPAGALGARELADGSLTALKFAQGTRPVQIVDGLPADPLDAGFLPGDAVVNVVDDDVKIHRLTLTPSGWDRWSAANDTWDAAASWPTGVWTSAVDTGDLKGLLAEGNFGDDLIVARMVAADQIGATELAAIRMEVGKWIRSFNWDPGVAGWAIDGDGNAEFNDVTVRGGLLVGGTVQTSALVSNDYVAGSAGWALDPAGNTELNDLTIRGAVAVGSGIVSSNYTAGTSGWAIDALGTVEFNDATFRGNIEASSVTSGQLVSANYSAGVDGWAVDAAGTAEFNDVTVRGVLDTRKGGTGLYTQDEYVNFYLNGVGVGDIGMWESDSQQTLELYSDGSIFLMASSATVPTINVSPTQVVITEDLEVGGDLFPGADNSYALGTSTWRWSEVWSVDGTINTSDVAHKEHVAPISLDDAARRVRAVGRDGAVTFRWPGRVRTHAGFDAGRVGQVHGDDTSAYVDPAVAGADGPKGLRPAEMIPDLYVTVAALLDRMETLESLSGAKRGT